MDSATSYAYWNVLYLDFPKCDFWMKVVIFKYHSENNECLNLACKSEWVFTEIRAFRNILLQFCAWRFDELENELEAQIILLYENHIQHQGSAFKQFNAVIKCLA